MTKTNKVENIVITFPDGKQQKYHQGITALEIAQKISGSLAKNYCSYFKW